MSWSLLRYEATVNLITNDFKDAEISEQKSRAPAALVACGDRARLPYPFCSVRPLGAQTKPYTLVVCCAWINTAYTDDRESWYIHRYRERGISGPN